jgi:hypothetical protein
MEGRSAAVEMINERASGGGGSPPEGQRGGAQYNWLARLARGVLAAEGQSQSSRTRTRHYSGRHLVGTCKCKWHWLLGAPPAAFTASSGQRPSGVWRAITYPPSAFCSPVSPTASQLTVAPSTDDGRCSVLWPPTACPPFAREARNPQRAGNSQRALNFLFPEREQLKDRRVAAVVFTSPPPPLHPHPPPHPPRALGSERKTGPQRAAPGRTGPHYYYQLPDCCCYRARMWSPTPHYPLLYPVGTAHRAAWSLAWGMGPVQKSSPPKKRRAALAAICYLLLAAALLALGQQPTTNNQLALPHGVSTGQKRFPEHNGLLRRSLLG